MSMKDYLILILVLVFTTASLQAVALAVPHDTVINNQPDILDLMN